MRSRLIPAVVVVIVLLLTAAILVWLAADDSAPANQAAPPAVQPIQVIQGERADLDLTASVTYVDLTVRGRGATPPPYVTFQAAQPAPGVVTIERCSVAYEADSCSGDVTQVLPEVDLQGWQEPLAAAGTSLLRAETAHLRVTVEGAADPVTLRLAIPKSSR